MDIKNFIFHHIIKNSNNSVSYKLSNQTIDINEDIEAFVGELIDKFNSNTPSYGVFQDPTMVEDDNIVVEAASLDPNSISFQHYSEHYFFGSLDFIEFTHYSCKLMGNMIDGSNRKDGFMAFAHYADDAGKEYLITAMLMHSNGVRAEEVSDAILLKSTKYLDIQKLDRANRISISGWKKSILDSTYTKNYLAFIRGRLDVTKFFKQFIGASNIKTTSQQLSQLNDAISDYFEENDIPLENQVSKLADVKSYLLDVVRNGDKEANIDTISNILDPQNPTSFSDFCHQSEDYNDIDGYIHVERESDINKMSKDTINGKKFKIQFDTDLIRTGELTLTNNTLKIAIDDVEVINHIQSIINDILPNAS